MKRPSTETMAESPEHRPPVPPNHRKKKTRELPNLSDCHCCNLRINSTNPKNRLQILSSEWRIVLLCKCCFNLVESSQFCSYCLTRVSCSSIDSVFECKRCHRRIHKQCVSMFSGNDFSSSKDEFSVCYDCWIPKLLENDYNARVVHNRVKKKGVKNGFESMNSLGSSGVCDSQEKEKGKAVEAAVNGTHVVAQKKVAVAVEAKEKAIGKALDSKKAVALASSAVGLNVVEKDGDRRGSVVDDDAQLAIRLHRAMNSSPRISRNLCLFNTHCIDVPENVDGSEFQAGGEMSCSSKDTNIRVYERNRLSATRQECEQQYVKTQDEKCGGDFDGLITYRRKGRTALEANCKEESDCFRTSCNRESSSGDIGTGIKEDCSMRTYERRLTKVKRCKVENGHCTKTYSRRHTAIPHCKSNMICGDFNLDNGTHAPAISFDCCEESRTFATAS